jgi:hypothetical protein
MYTSGPRVKLFTLWQRTSARGIPYLSGYLGNCGVVCFIDEDAELREGVECVWNVYLQQGDEQPQRQRAAAAQQPRRPRRVQRRPKPPPSDDDGPPLDDPVDDIGRSEP